MTSDHVRAIRRVCVTAPSAAGAHRYPLSIRPYRWRSGCTHKKPDRQTDADPPGIAQRLPSSIRNPVVARCRLTQADHLHVVAHCVQRYRHWPNWNLKNILQPTLGGYGLSTNVKMVQRATDGHHRITHYRSKNVEGLCCRSHCTKTVASASKILR